jgi:alpha-beta hydrolase superfamily lysophospholipase
MILASPVQFVATLAFWLLCLIGLAALALVLALAVPLSRPPMLASIHETASAVDRSGMPDLSRLQVRDGSDIAYRFYPAQASVAGDERPRRIAILAHGSSASSIAMHALAKALADKGVAAYALDIRGHGHSGARGDIGYIGQLDDDLADFVEFVHKNDPDARLQLIGHSSGGGVALHIAGSPLQSQFERVVLLAPYLGYDAPSSRPNAGGWARPDIPRILALSLLRTIGVDCCSSLPVLAFATAPNSQSILTSVYSYRLMRGYATNDYRGDFAKASTPIAIFAGGDDELMDSDRYAEAIKGFESKATLHTIPGTNHMAIVSGQTALAAIAADVAAN